MPDKTSFAKRVFLVALGVSLAVVLLAVLLGIFKYADKSNPTRYFGEGRFPTALSVLQLAATGILLALAFWRRRAAGARFWSGAAIWLAGAAGFVFFALDEWLEIHENLDRWIHVQFIGAKATPLTDRIDDLIILGYGLAGAVMLAICSREVFRYRAAWPYVAFAGASGVLSVALDTLTNLEDILQGAVHTWSTVGEDAFKLLAEAGFLGAAAFVFAAARSPGSQSGASH